MKKMSLNQVAKLLKFKNPQNLYHLEKSGKFNPDKNILGKIIIPDELAKLIEEGCELCNWNTYIKLKHKKMVKLIKIIDFYDIPVAVCKICQKKKNEIYS